jgi:hypothetical protein
MICSVRPTRRSLPRLRRRGQVRSVLSELIYHLLINVSDSQLPNHDRYRFRRYRFFHLGQSVLFDFSLYHAPAPSPQSPPKPP